MIADYQAGKLTRGGKIMAFIVSFHNILYMSLNLIMFPSEHGFF